MTGERVSDYEYDLPEGRIARYPAERRDGSRLLVLPRGGGETRHLRFRDIVGLFRPGDLLVVNESRVLPARLLGRKPTGARAEILLLHPWVGSDDPEERARAAARTGSGVAPEGAVPASPPEVAEASSRATLWEALVRPGSKLKPGRRVVVSPELEVEIIDSVDEGGRIVRLRTGLLPGEALERFGHVPLPPYLEREDEPLDRERYQTVFARRAGSVAAPTAGLHFTPGLLDELAERGVERTAVTLHVGVGTFRPVEVENPGEHEMHAEAYRVPADAARAVTEARRRGGRVWAVGTTVVRTLETVAREYGGRVEASSGLTRLFIRPPFDFRVVDCLVTNFHLPRSTLLMLVGAFAGREATLEAYGVAVEAGYRFYSYGDAMAVVGDPPPPSPEEP